MRPTILADGLELPDSYGAHYTVTALRRRSGVSVLYDARKTFLNYRYREREFYPAGPDEQLPVLLRCPCYPDDDPQTAEGMREMLHFEATQVLTLHGARWFPEPLDLLALPLSLAEGRQAGPPTRNDPAPPPPPIANGAPEQLQTSDPSDLRRAVRRSALVLVRPHGDPLQHWCAGDAERVARMGCAREALELVALVHREGLLLGAFDPRDFLVDPDGRLYYLGTDRIVRESRMPRLRRFFPPERYFEPWAAPEAIDAQGWLDRRSDLYSWAALSVWLLTFEPDVPSNAAEPEPHDPAVFDPRAIDSARLRNALLQLERRDPSLLVRPTAGSARAAVDRWTQALASCLDPDPERRPASVEELDGMLFGAPSATPAPRRGWRKLFGR
jgi:hypothetical protein